MRKQWRPSDELIEELGLDPDDWDPNVSHAAIMGDASNPNPHRPMFAQWRRRDVSEPMSFPDTGALMNWVATDMDDQELEDLFREIHDALAPIFVIKSSNLESGWHVDEEAGAYMIAFGARR